MIRMISAVRFVVGTMGMATAMGLPSFSATAFAEGPPPQISKDDAAVLKLNAGRKAFNEKKYPLALAAFKEFIAEHASHREAGGAWYGIGLCILAVPQPDYPAAVEAFQKACAGDFPDKAFAHYYWGNTLRAIGSRAAADALLKPNEAEALRKTANQKFVEAAAQFTTAVQAFSQRVTEAPPAAPAPLPVDLEWASRARCDAAEMMLELGKYREAGDASLPFQSDPVLSRSRYKPLALYHLGYAQFALHDYLAAGRSLSQLAPFSQEFGMHARYMLARVHHLSDEAPEAAAQYKAISDEYETRKKAAEQAMQNPALDAEHKAQAETLARGPLPDYVLRARFYGAVLQYEGGLFAEAGQTFQTILQQNPKHPLANEAKLRMGFCWMQLKKFKEAIAALEPLKEDKAYADRAQWWLARCRVGMADSNNAVVVTQALTGSIDALRQAAERAKNMAATDPDAKIRRTDILLELGDTQQLAKQHKEAAATYQIVATEAANSDRAEEAAQRRVTALHLAGLFKESDQAAAQFLATYPKSTLLPAVLFRQAENAYRAALLATDDKASKPKAEQTQAFASAITLYQKFIAKYPEFEYADLARQALATCHARSGQYQEAVAILQTIPESSRTGDLALVPYLMADCEIRTLPPEAEDALTAERLVDTATDAAKFLESFLGAQPKGPQAPDALLKLGYCYQRIAGELAKAQDRQKFLTKAREAYERSLKDFPNDPAQPSVAFERAKCMAMMGDVGGAQNELKKFQSDPLKKSPNAPLALIRLSSLLRAAGQPQQAAEVMKQARDTFETTLAADPSRADWVAMMKYEHGLALQDQHKLPEARAMFEEVIKQFAGKPEAVNASWRVAQCRRQEAAEKLADARNTARRPGVNPNDVSTAYSRTDEPLKQLAQVTETLRTQTDAQATASPKGEATLRMLYELAWCYRVQGDAQTDSVRLKLAREAVDKVRARWPKDQPSPAAILSPPEIPLSEIPVQPAEQKATEAYQRLVFAGPATALASQARFELAELLCQRNQIDPALELLATALENQPPKPLAQRIKVRVAAALLAKNNPQPALAQLQPILTDKESPVGAEAKYLAGEALIQQQDWPKAIELLTPFRDQDPWKNAQGIADRAMMRLAFAMEQAKQWEPARQTYEALISRFNQSPWIDEARYGMGWSLQNQRRYDDAVNTYTDLAHRSVSEFAARGQLNAGICRIEQKRPGDALKSLLLIPLTYDYTDLSAAACFNAARAHLDEQKPDDAKKMLQRVIKEYPSTSWASQAQKQLAEMR